MNSTESNLAFELACACKVGRILGGHDSNPLLRQKVAGVVPWSKPKSAAPHSNNLCLNGEGLRGVTRDAVRLAFKESGGKILGVSRRLKVNRSTAYELVKRHLT